MSSLVQVLAPQPVEAASDPQARASALLAAVREANARRLTEAQTRAAELVAEAESINATFLELAEQQALMLLGATPLPTRAGAGSPDQLARAEPATASIDGGVDLVAGPFARFSQLASFTRSVRALSGVLSVDTRQFFKGSVHLRLRYDDPIPLAVRLAELTEFAPSIVAAANGRVELRVNLAPTETADAAEEAAPDSHGVD